MVDLFAQQGRSSPVTQEEIDDFYSGGSPSPRHTLYAAEDARLGKLIASKRRGMRALVARAERCRNRSIVLVGGPGQPWDRAMECYDGEHRERAL
jgi:hypothetical protein